MGSFYTNVAVRTADADAVLRACAGRTVFVTPAVDGWVVVYDEATENQDDGELTDLAMRLSRATGALALAALNHDDDVLQLWAVEGGEVVDAYNSSPDWFDACEEPPSGGERLAELLGAIDPDGVEEILRSAFGLDLELDEDADVDVEEDGYVFETERHQDLALALGLPAASVGFGYRYVVGGHRPEGIGTLRSA